MKSVCPRPRPPPPLPIWVGSVLFSHFSPLPALEPASLNIIKRKETSKGWSGAGLRPPGKTPRGSPDRVLPAGPGAGSVRDWVGLGWTGLGWTGGEAEGAGRQGGGVAAKWLINTRGCRQGRGGVEGG